MIAYLITIFLSVLVASAELFAKFRDEPFEVFKKSPACLYLLFNLAIASLSLYMLTKTTLFNAANELDSLKAALIAGLGSTICFRTKARFRSIACSRVSRKTLMIISGPIAAS